MDPTADWLIRRDLTADWLICPNSAAADAANSLVAEKLLNLGELSLAAPTH
jgi:hypothetical protein